MHLLTDHAVGGEVLVLCLEVDSVLVVLTDLHQALHEQLFTVSDPLGHLRQRETERLAPSYLTHLSRMLRLM